MRKKRVILFLIIMIILNITNRSNATSFTFEAEANKKEVVAGEEILVEMNISDIDMGQHGINVIEGILEYDEDFFTSMEFVQENDWETIYNDEDGERKGKFLITKMTEGVKVQEVVGNIKFKIREDITQGEGQIKIKEIKSNDGEKLVNQGERIITIKIKNQENIEEPKEEIKEENDKLEADKEEILITNNVKTGDNIIFVISIMFIAIIANIIIIKVRKRDER